MRFLFTWKKHKLGITLINNANHKTEIKTCTNKYK